MFEEEDLVMATKLERLEHAERELDLLCSAMTEDGDSAKMISRLETIRSKVYELKMMVIEDILAQRRKELKEAKNDNHNL